MITQLRKKLSGPVTQMFIFIAVLGILGVFSLPMLIKQGSKPWVFKINKHTVSQTEFEYEVSMQRDRIAFYKEQYGQFADMIFNSMGMSTDPKILATDIITKKVLLNDIAYNSKLNVSEKYIQEKFADQKFAANYLGDVVPQFLYDQQGNLQNIFLRMYLQKWGLSASAFLEKVKESLLRQTAIHLINHTAYVPLYEQSLFVANQHGTKNLQLLILDQQAFVEDAKKTKPSQAVLKQFFEEKNKTAQTYFVPETRNITVWTFDAQAYGITIDQQQILEYYNKYKTQKFIASQSEVVVRQLVYKQQPENAPSIATLQEELSQDPALFIEYVKKYSQDESSAKNGGLIDPLVHGKSNSPLYKAAFLLKEVGSISPVISVDNSFVILQLVKKEPKIYKSLDSVKKEIVLQLKKQQFKNQFSKELRSIFADGIIDQNELEILVKLHGATKKVMTGITMQQKDAVTRAAFAINSKGKGQQISAKDEEIMIVKLDNITSKYLPDFETVIDTVRSDWYGLQGALALQKVYTNIQELLPTKTLSEISDLVKIPLKTIVLEGAMDKKNSKILEQYNISREDIMSIEKEGSLLFSTLPSGAYFAYCSSCQKNDEHLTVTKEEKDALERATKELIIEGLIASLHRDAKIETNESFSLPLEDYLV